MVINKIWICVSIHRWAKLIMLITNNHYIYAVVNLILLLDKFELKIIYLWQYLTIYPNCPVVQICKSNKRQWGAHFAFRKEHFLGAAQVKTEHDKNQRTWIKTQLTEEILEESTWTIFISFDSFPFSFARFFLYDSFVQE